VTSTTDICIAGGGPAGLAASLALRKEGFTVTLVDCAIPPIDKACGEGLMPDSVVALARLGVTLPPDAGYPFTGIRFSDARSSVAANFSHGHGVGLRRTVLHELLVQHAHQAGVEMIWNAKGVALAHHGITLNGRALKAGFVIGADGQKSSTRVQAALNRIKSERKRYGFRWHYRIAPWSAFIEIYWGACGQVYITPVAKDEVCVALISPNSKLRLDEALKDFPELRGKLANVPHASNEMGAMSVSRRLERVYRDGVALLGDASGSVDAITGEGLCLAFKQAAALARALKSGDLSEYQSAHDKISATPHRMASLMLTLQLSQGLQRRTLAALAKRPQIFESLLKYHVGEGSLFELCSRHLLSFGFDFMRG
jgi:flavin-dependent dehydrogenase